MSKLATNALVSVAEYLSSFSGKREDNQNIEIERQEFFINAASKHIEEYCGRKFVPSATVAEIRGGDGTSSIYVHNIPLTTLTSIEYWNGTDWTVLSTDNAPRDSDVDTREIWFTQGHIFADGKKNYRITYVYGYSTANVPADLKRAACQLVQRAQVKADGKEGITSQSFGDHTTSYDLAKIPDDIREVLDRYKRISLG